MRPRPLLNRPGVTVVIPCYNYGRFLKDAVSSALSQENVDVDVIVVDDASTDGSAAIAWKLAAADPRISVVHHEQNQGHIATYNDGLSRAGGRYVTLLSADDVLAPGALGRAVALMEANPRVGMVYGLPKDFVDQPVPVHAHGRVTWTVWEGSRWIRLACARGRNFILSPEVVMRTETVLGIGAYSASLPHSGDLEYWLRAAGSWDVGRINGPVQAFYRVHGNNMHQTEFAAAAVDLRHRLEAFRVLEDARFPIAPKQRVRQLRRAEGALSREAWHLGAREVIRGGSVETAIELRKFIECLQDVPGNVHRANSLQARINRVSRGGRPGPAQSAAEYVRSQLDRVRWRLWAMTGIS
ncbi:glycosyltransferase family 2 protein [Paenarthrobacter aurescens]|nr:glycosyltransferase [Paenarthrobacter aurescens]UKA52026.1 glycosyltransferase [Arthrobacter sp. FW305-123]MDO6143600.1 glycosyltransferase [Paenarthrobacter aurescens]MDO6147448.1 glycosyltransferase [Paenarthrobacter aurescens]MDO6158692.1 glycosyltransferase [Paenarthrobacter aurescens]MDO6162675.1 glycosyltransferase [Paenarthrobacter aurescens]